MSAQEIASRLLTQVSVAHPEALPHFFEGFKTDLILQADDMAHGRITAIFAREAVAAARHRAEKFRTSATPVYLADFVPAFDYIRELASPRRRPNLRTEDVVIFTAEISELIRQCCPWC